MSPINGFKSLEIPQTWTSTRCVVQLFNLAEPGAAIQRLPSNEFAGQSPVKKFAGQSVASSSDRSIVCTVTESS